MKKRYVCPRVCGVLLTLTVTLSACSNMVSVEQALGPSQAPAQPLTRAGQQQLDDARSAREFGLAELRRELNELRESLLAMRKVHFLVPARLAAFQLELPMLILLEVLVLRPCGVSAMVRGHLLGTAIC